MAIATNLTKRRAGLLVAAIAALAVGCSVSAPSPHAFGEVVSSPAADQTLPDVRPDGPGAFADDPRLGQCFGPTEDMEFVFEMTHGRDYQSYLPAMLRSPELDIDDAVLIVVYEQGFEEPPHTGFPGAGPNPTPEPGRRFVCAVVPELGPILYGDVDISGITVAVTPSSPRPSSELQTAEPLSSGPTPTPAPAWLAGAEAALGCDGTPSGFGSEWEKNSLGTSEWTTPAAALADFVKQVQNFYVPFPAAGYQLIGQTDEAAAFAYGRLGSPRAIVRLRNVGTADLGGWYIDDVAGCDPSEWGEDAHVPVKLTIWTDAGGASVPTTAVEEIEDCYNATKLTVNGRLFVWDPMLNAGSYDPAQLEATFSATDALPAAAIDTGFHAGDRRLYLAVDGTAAFTVTGSTVNRWPHVKGDEYQRIDCN
ncbi:MAG TPA: hypothetical protein VFV72_14380 [Candidatus Limnocylindrales bacterium]|nr:hypothetical protein [Candidatus Limnocylindrales bacterium]